MRWLIRGTPLLVVAALATPARAQDFPATVQVDERGATEPSRNYTVNLVTGQALLLEKCGLRCPPALKEDHSRSLTPDELAHLRSLASDVKQNGLNDQACVDAYKERQKQAAAEIAKSNELWMSAHPHQPLPPPQPQGDPSWANMDVEGVGVAYASACLRKPARELWNMIDAL